MYLHVAGFEPYYNIFIINSSDSKSDVSYVHMDLGK